MSSSDADASISTAPLRRRGSSSNDGIPTSAFTPSLPRAPSVYLEFPEVYVVLDASLMEVAESPHEALDEETVLKKIRQDILGIRRAISVRDLLTGTTVQINPLQLRQTLLMVGCRPPDAHAIVLFLAEVLHKVFNPSTYFANSPSTQGESEAPSSPSQSDASWGPSPRWRPSLPPDHPLATVSNTLKTLTFLRLLQFALRSFEYFHSHMLLDLAIASQLATRRRSAIILIAGVPGTGKSTLAFHLANQLQIATVLATDSIRHAARHFYTKKENPILYASTYNAGDHVDESEGLSKAERVLKGYLLQSAMVSEFVETFVAGFVRERESVIVEGVHLTVDFMVELCRKHAACVPFLVFIEDEERHMGRFQVRGKNMTLDPKQNKYIGHLPAIRQIQHHLLSSAHRLALPTVDNTCLHQSLSILHASTVTRLRNLAHNRPAFEPAAASDADAAAAAPSQPPPPPPPPSTAHQLSHASSIDSSSGEERREWAPPPSAEVGSALSSYLAERESPSKWCLFKRMLDSQQHDVRHRAESAGIVPFGGQEGVPDEADSTTVLQGVRRESRSRSDADSELEATDTVHLPEERFNSFRYIEMLQQEHVDEDDLEESVLGSVADFVADPLEGSTLETLMGWRSCDGDQEGGDAQEEETQGTT
ncbi:unnamed protein product [Vitrella brassicaformis CCMP3155]|uniref:Zeta toxin domain-containing protein n=1 Tax=Vitrella brassicaformis (strain CCMP3155) TaxID=1169540 RepID=A0A0G4GXE9_VITBC|nr:unnamed protein product [Vitrella brassicaformis CCMP3155]|eukprot:CEM35656.1 unnamed protein product [Vitrella brassicaformis CCMP3155]